MLTQGWRYRAACDDQFLLLIAYTSHAMGPQHTWRKRSRPCQNCPDVVKRDLKSMGLGLNETVEATCLTDQYGDNMYHLGILKNQHSNHRQRSSAALL